MSVSRSVTERARIYVGVTHTAVTIAGYLTGICRRRCAVLEWNDHGTFEQLCETVLECIAHAALWRVLRKSRFDDGSPLVQFFRLDLSGEWAAFIEASKELAELVIDGKPDGTGFGTDEETERLESLRKPFLSLLAKAQEES